MAIRGILTYPNPRLAITSEDVTEFDAELTNLIEDMFETMYAAPGIGLAAPQIDVPRNIFVIDIDYERDEETNAISGKSPHVFINPRIYNRAGEMLYKEGCLSVPGIYEEVKRSEMITVDYFDVSGKKHTKDFEGLMAVAIQHENDHLLGRLFIDRLSFIKSRSIKKRIKREALE
jgi:peptide deformylase